jgi:hypothetical protein
VNQERWKPVPGFEGYYEASDQGRVRSVDRTVAHARWGTIVRKGKILSPGVKSKYGHLGVTLCRDNMGYQKHVHYLVLETFVCPRPPGLECRHLNGDPGDNRLMNLAWGTRRQNSGDRTHGRAARHGLDGRWIG